MITMEVFLDTGEREEGPLASCRMDGKRTKLSLLSPRNGTFPGSQNSKPPGTALSDSDAREAGPSPYMGGRANPPVSRELHSLFSPD